MNGAGPFALAQALTRKTERLCAGLAHGDADILELVTPTTARLLRWWFDGAACRARRFNFRPAQRRVILNTIVAHEVLAAPTLRSLYELVAPAALANGERLLEIIRPRYFHPSYCIGTGRGALLVLQALLIWQLLNKTAALRRGRDDSRFTQRFFLVAPHVAARDRLLHLFGPAGDGVERRALLMPAQDRDHLLEFQRSFLCDIATPLRGCAAAGLLAIAARPLDLGVDALGVLASLPDLMLFDSSPDGAEGEGVWQKTLTRLAVDKGRRFVQVDFRSMREDREQGRGHPAHVVGDLDAPEVP